MIPQSKILTEKEMIDTMLVQAQNDLTKAKLKDRLFQRGKHGIAGLNNQEKLMMGQNQTVIRGIEETIMNLLELRKNASEELPPLAETLGLK